MSNYPAGAAYDSSAPYNQSDGPDIYKEAERRINEEIKNRVEAWTYFLRDMEPDTKLSDLKQRYFEFRYDEVAREIKDEIAAEQERYEDYLDNIDSYM